jgi:hypothetical protein
MYDSSSLFNISIVEMMIEKLGEFESSKIERVDHGIQVELIKQDKTVNNMLLNELAIASVRKEVE